MKIYLLIIFYFLFVSTEAQVEDRFDDGDFTDSPVWSGNDSDFNVNTARQLQLNASLAGNSFLSVPANLTSLDSSEWHIYIRCAFSPSSSNFARFYISSDREDITQPLNGYFLQFGESLSNDAIELFKQSGTTITSVCRARNGLISSAFSAGVKLTRSQSGRWTLFVDYDGGNNYAVEAIGNDASFNTAGWIGIDCNYTVGNIDKFFFDDFYAGPVIQDTSLPFVFEVSAESESVLGQINTEINDRYGTMPDSVNNLFDYARLRKTAEQMHVLSVDKANSGLAIKLGENAKVAPEKLMEFLSKNSTASFSPNGILRIEVKVENLIEAARAVLEDIRA